MGAEFFGVDGQTRLAVIFSNFVNVSKSGCLAIFYVARDVPILSLTYNNNNNNNNYYYYYYYGLIVALY
jgi:hypothetical protein